MNDVLSRVPTQHFIAGQWIGDPALPVHDPATGDVIATIADADVPTAISALDATVDTADTWADTDPRDRAELLRACYEAIIDRADDFATLMTLEMGKPIDQAHGEVTYGADFFRWYSEEAVRIHGRFGRAPSGNQYIITDKQPIGPVYAITPWNFPLAMATRKIGPALAAGCTVVIKPASETPLTTLYLLKVMTDAGLPPGVVNAFTTTNSRGTTTALLTDPRLRKLTFTGSTPVGQNLLEQAATNVLRTSMELGGNAPLIVLKDANLDQAIHGALLAKMRNNGQACTAANRFYIHETLADEFTTRLHTELQGWNIGPGIDPASQLSALIHDRAINDILDLVTDATHHGADLVLGGHKLDRPGSFLPPTILTGITPEARIAHEEIFGPVIPIQTFTDTDEAITRANNTNYGLMSYVFGEQAQALRVARQLQYGLVGINTGLVSNAAAPFGGTKHSGLGREGAQEGIEEYLETKYYGMPL